MACEKYEGPRKIYYEIKCKTCEGNDLVKHKCCESLDLCPDCKGAGYHHKTITVDFLEVHDLIELKKGD